jgi:hypothetical protein
MWVSALTAIQHPASSAASSSTSPSAHASEKHKFDQLTKALRKQRDDLIQHVRYDRIHLILCSIP